MARKPKPLTPGQRMAEMEKEHKLIVLIKDQRIKDLIAQCDKLQSERDDAVGKVHRLDKAVADANAQVNQLKSRVESLEVECNHKRKARDIARAERDRALGYIDRLRDEKASTWNGPGERVEFDRYGNRIHRG